MDNLCRLILEAVEAVSLAWTRGRLRALHEHKQRREPKPKPKQTPPKRTFADHVQLIATGKAEKDAAQQEWTDNEAAISAGFTSGPDGANWTKERARRVAKLRRLHERDRTEQFGLDHDQIAQECGIPSDVARGLREQF